MKRELKRKWRKSKLVLVLALIFSVAATVPVTMTWASGEIDIGKKCSVDIEISESEEFKELKSCSVTTKLYKIADINANGRFTALNGYTDLQDRLNKLDGKTKAADWEEIVSAAENDAKTQQPAVTAVVKNGTCSVADLPSGLYLVLADPVTTNNYSYSFTNGLVSLPDNAYYSLKKGNNEWIYDHIKVDLKPARMPREGELVIEKTLKNYNPKLGNPVFVFDVEAYKDGQIVYSNAVSISFDASGTKSLHITGLPSGSKVVVTEVYSGACYSLKSSDSITIESIQAGETKTASFTNDYNDKLVYGTGVVNHYEYDGHGYSWSQLKDNSGTENGVTK